MTRSESELVGRKRVLAATGSVVVVGAALWSMTVRETDAYSGSDDSVGPPSTVFGEYEPETEREVHARHPSDQTAGSLELHVLGVGASARPEVSYLTRDDHRSLGLPLMGSWGSSGANPWSAASLRGDRAVLRVPAGHWVWIGVAWRSPEQGVEHLRYLRVEPFHGCVRRVIDLSAGRPRIHVFLGAPENGMLTDAECGVRLWMRNRRGSGFESKQELTVDRWGYGTCPDLPEGLVFTSSRGCGPDETAPYVARVPWSPAQDHDKVVHLVSKGPIGTVALYTTMSARPAAGILPILYLEAMDRVPSRAVPLMSRIRLGVNPVVEKQVPVGRYRLHALPLGVFGRSVVDRFVNVFADERSEVRCVLAVADADCHLEIVGVPTKSLPMSVLLRDSGSLDVTRRATAVIGPFAWNDTSQSVPRVRKQARLEVRGRGAWYLSREDVDMNQTGRVKVRVDPACRVSLLLSRADLCATKGLVASLSSSLGSERIRLSALWERTPNGYRRRLKGSFLLPRGRCTVTLVDPGRGAVLYQEAIHLTTDVHNLTVR